MSSQNELNSSLEDVRQQRRREKRNERHELKRAVEQMQTENDELRQTVKEQDAELTILKYQPRNDDSDHGHRSTRKKAKLEHASAPKVRRFGRWFASCKVLWLPTGFWAHFIPREEQEDGDDSESEPELDPIEHERCDRAVGLFKEVIPSDLKRYSKCAWFESDVLLGMREIRSTFVSNLNRDIHNVFGAQLGNLDHFNATEKSKRPLIPEVDRLLKDYRFLYDSHLLASGNKEDAHLRSPAVLKALTLLLYGPVCMKNGIRPKVRETNGEIWGLTEVTHGLLAFVASALYYVLSDAHEFTEVHGVYDFGQFYRTRMQMLSILEEKKPVKHRKLMAYFNKALFPRFHGSNDPNDSQHPEEREMFDLLNTGGDDDDDSAGFITTQTQSTAAGEHHTHSPMVPSHPSRAPSADSSGPGQSQSAEGLET